MSVPGVARCGDVAAASAVVVVGLGNIGSHLAPLLARAPCVERLTLIDHDAYAQTNLDGQDITAADLGRPKALVQAERLRCIHPDLTVVPVSSAVEAVPLGLLRAAVVLSCVDSRASRVYLNGACSRVGSLWIDAGVQAEGLLARVNVYVPGPDNPCLECAFDEHDYRLLAQAYPCAGEPDAPAATNAPASLGAVAAGLQAIECKKLLAGHTAQVLAGRQVLLDAAWHKHYVTTYARNPACRFDHRTWDVGFVDRRPADLSIGDALTLCTRPGGDRRAVALRIEGQVFVRGLTCPSCGAFRDVSWRLSGRLGAEGSCRACDRAMLSSACDVTDWLTAAHLAPAAVDQPLAALGLCAGDVVVLRDAMGERYLQLGWPDAWRLPPAGAPDVPGRLERGA